MPQNAMQLNLKIFLHLPAKRHIIDVLMKSQEVNKMKKMLMLTMILMLLLAGCAAEKEDAAPVAAEEPLTLSIGVMPAVDSAPIFLAEKEGYFEDLGLDIEIQVYMNAMNRQSALISGELDGAMTDVIALVNNVDNGFDIKVTTSTDGSFPILLRKDFEESPEVTVGMMEVSVSNYLSDAALKDDYTLEKIYINEIPARLEMIKSGQIDMAVLPEPIASMGALAGLEKRVYENPDDYYPEVMVFTGTAIEEKAEALEAFHRGYDRAVEAIRADESLAREVLVERLELNPEVKDLMHLPTYQLSRVPDEAYLDQIMTWNETVIGKTIDLGYEELVDDRFVAP